MRLKRDDRDDEAKNKNDINEESEEEASCHKINCCHCKYDADWYAEYELLTDDDCHYCEGYWEDEESKEDEENEENEKDEEDL